jgi:membrane protease YdiL (CAAX protease family)
LDEHLNLEKGVGKMSSEEPSVVAPDSSPNIPRQALPGILAILVVVGISYLDAVIPPAGIPLAVLAIWLILRWQGQGWRSLGFRRPASWPRTILIASGIALAWQAIGVVGMLLARGAAGAEGPDISRFESIEGDVAMLAQWLTVAWTTAGFGEEIIWRGFLMSRVAGLLGDGKRAWVAALLISSVVFGLLHFYQGPSGVVMTGLSGLLLGLLFLLSGRNLWLPILTHGLLNTISFLAIYFGLVQYLDSL